MSHCNTVTDSDCREHDRSSSSHCHAKLYGLCDFIQVHVAWYDLIIGTNDSY